MFYKEADKLYFMGFMIQNVLNLKIDPNVVVFGFHCMSLSWTVEPL